MSLRHPWAISAIGAVVAPILLTGCALQPGYVSKPLMAPTAWSTASPDTVAVAVASATPADQNWWTALGDSAVDALTPISLVQSPTLAQAVARIDEARAALGSNSALRVPSVSVDMGAERARSLGTGTTTTTGGVANAGLRLGWELDLFGRVRQSVEAASSRLDARSADAQSARLALAAQVAHGVVGLRACLYSEQVQAADIASRAKLLELVRRRLAAGAVAQVEEARAVTSLAAARTKAILQQEQCARQTHALTSLSGQDSAAIRKLVTAPVEIQVESNSRSAFMPKPPPLVLSLPATVLAAHPDVVAAERAASAAWAEVAVARAERLPRIDLGGLLTGNVLHAGGSSMNYSTWSLAASLTAPLFDGGAGAANVDAASARYRSTEAVLRQAVRLAARDVENALAGSASAHQRQSTAQEALQAARVALRATHAQWEAGAVSLFELEDAQRQHASADDDAIAALRDNAQAWIALVQSSGNTVVVRSATPKN